MNDWNAFVAGFGFALILLNVYLLVVCWQIRKIPRWKFIGICYLLHAWICNPIDTKLVEGIELIVKAKDKNVP